MSRGGILPPPVVITLSSPNTVMKTFICEQCGKSFSQATNLSRHKKVHITGKFECLSCFSKFSSQSSVDQHYQQIVHSVSISSPGSFCCDTCGNKFTPKIFCDRSLFETKKRKSARRVLHFYSNFIGSIQSDFEA